jgi:hypothetical protein
MGGRFGKYGDIKRKSRIRPGRPIRKKPVTPKRPLRRKGQVVKKYPDPSAKYKDRLA